MDSGFSWMELELRAEEFSATYCTSTTRDDSVCFYVCVCVYICVYGALCICLSSAYSILYAFKLRRIVYSFMSLRVVFPKQRHSIHQLKVAPLVMLTSQKINLIPRPE